MRHPILAGLAGFGLFVALISLAFGLTARMVFGTPAVIKQALADSGIYQTIASSLVSEASDSVPAQTGLGLDDAQVKQAATVSFPAGNIQRDAEKAIDQSYAWLDGSSKTLDVRIDTQPYMAAFSQKVSDQALASVERLPACTPAQLQQLQASAATVTSLADIPCRPPDAALAAVRQQIASQISASSDSSSNDMVLGTDDLSRDSAGKTAVDKLSWLPASFQWIMRLPLIASVLTAFCITALLVLYRQNQRSAYKTTSKLVLSAGLSLAIPTLISHVIFNATGGSNGLLARLVSGEYRDAILKFIAPLEHGVFNMAITISIVYVIIGLLGLIGLKLTARSLVDTEQIK